MQSRAVDDFFQKNSFSSNDSSDNISNHPLFQTDKYLTYQSSLSEQELSLPCIQLAYLFTLHKECQNIQTYNVILDIIKVFIDRGINFNTKILQKSRYPWELRPSRLSLFGMAIELFDQLESNQSNEINNIRLLKLIIQIYQKNPSLDELYFNTLSVPTKFWQRIIIDNDIETIMTLVCLIRCKDVKKIIKFALMQSKIEIVKSIIKSETEQGQSFYQDWLIKLGVWPLKNSPEAKTSMPTSYSNNSYKIAEVINILSRDFSIDEDNTIFNILFPFSNEKNYEKIIKQLNIINIARQSDTLNFESRGKIKVAILFGESRFLSILPEISKFVDILLMADVEPRQHKHISHLITCFNQANNQEEFVQQYLQNNPIMNEAVSSGERKGIASDQFLASNMKKFPVKYNFLSSSDRFNECKEAAKKIVIHQVKLDLMDPVKCELLATQLKHFNATFTFANLTNIHHYDEQNDKLCYSVPKLLQFSSKCLVMYAKGEMHHELRTTLTNGLTYYFSKCLKKQYKNYALSSDATESPVLDENKVPLDVNSTKLYLKTGPTVTFFQNKSINDQITPIKDNSPIFQNT